MRTIIVGDIHGCGAEFEDLLDVAGYDSNGDRLLLTGDILSKGPDPIRVWERIGQTRAEMVLGNHDDRLLTHLRGIADGQPRMLKNQDHVRLLKLVTPVIEGLLPWLGGIPLFISDPKFLLVHAGINPSKGLEDTSRDEFLAIRTWPPTGGIEGPRWHDSLSPDSRLIIFGHDAPGGLVEKRRPDGSPYAIGLDTGCVYGNQLSAYILEEDRFVQVESRSAGT